MSIGSTSSKLGKIDPIILAVYKALLIQRGFVERFSFDLTSDCGVLEREYQIFFGYGGRINVKFCDDGRISCDIRVAREFTPIYTLGSSQPVEFVPGKWSYNEDY